MILGVELPEKALDVTQPALNIISLENLRLFITFQNEE